MWDSRFSSYKIIDRRPPNSGEVKVNLPQFIDGSPTPEDFLGDNGVHVLHLNSPTDNDRHLALGQFMDAWSQLEISIARLLQLMLKTEHANMPVVMNSLGARGQLDTIAQIASQQLDGDALNDLKAIIARIRSNNTRRNSIVHGKWVLEIRIVLENSLPKLKYRQFRVYDPSHTNTETNPSNSFRKNYYFSPGRIRSITRSIRDVDRELSHFVFKHYDTEGAQQSGNFTIG